MPRIRTLPELEAEAVALASRLAPKPEGATLITLSGELGAGKTAFAKAFARALGVTEDVVSPTFVLARTYSLQDQAFSTLVHVDAYRLEDERALAPLRLEEHFTQNDTLILIEWHERVHAALPRADIAVSLSLAEDGSRELTYG